MSETKERVLRADAFSARRLNLITDEIPTRAEALAPSFWKDFELKPRDVVSLATQEGELSVLVSAPAHGGGWNVRPL